MKVKIGLTASESQLTMSVKVKMHFPQVSSTLSSVSSVSQSCPISSDPMNCSTPSLPVHHQLPEFTQTHVHQVSDAIQPSHPLSSPSPPNYNEISPHTSQNGHHQKVYKQQMLERMCRKRNSPTLLVEMYTDTVTMEEQYGGSLKG